MTIYDLFGQGWTAEPASLYDEEGVEGWRWYDPDYNEHATVIGLWSEPPPLPDCDCHSNESQASGTSDDEQGEGRE